MTDATQPSPQPAEDLVAELEDCFGWPGGFDVEVPADLGRRIRAALARERELRGALRELVAETEEVQEGYCQMLEDEWSSTVDRSDGPALTKAKALLAQPAAGEESERG